MRRRKHLQIRISGLHVLNRKVGSAIPERVKLSRILAVPGIEFISNGNGTVPGKKVSLRPARSGYCIWASVCFSIRCAGIVKSKCFA